MGLLESAGWIVLSRGENLESKEGTKMGRKRSLKGEVYVADVKLCDVPGVI